jgi:plasmid stabilization system protein ParE
LHTCASSLCSALSRRGNVRKNGIRQFIASDSPKAAARIDQLFSNAAAQPARRRWSGRPGEISGTREFFPHPNHRLVYQISDDALYVLALVHAARQWPPEGDSGVIFSSFRQVSWPQTPFFPETSFKTFSRSGRH